MVLAFGRGAPTIASRLDLPLQESRPLNVGRQPTHPLCSFVVDGGSANSFITAIAYSLRFTASGMHQTSDSTAPASATTAMLGTSVSSSTLSTGLRKVRLSDHELFQRVQQIDVPDGPVDLGGFSNRQGWKHMRAGVTGSMKMYFREIDVATTTPPFQTRQCQVVVGGEIRAQVDALLSLLRSSTESESNALLRALFGSHFIYSSLVHAVVNSERGLSSTSRESGAGTGAIIGQQLMVRTASFVHTGRFNPFKRRSSTPVVTSREMAMSRSHSLMYQHESSDTKNEQCCYIELLTPTQQGFKLVFCSLDAADITAGKAPPECVIPLHPLQGWLIAEPTPHNPETLQLTFQGVFLGTVPCGCDVRVAHDRLVFIGKGICRLEKVLRHRQRQPHSTPGRLWQYLIKPFRALGVSDDESSGERHYNRHCIACTRSFLPTLSKRWRRCDLCAYRVCAEPPCCSHERVAIYNRYVAPLLICARCRECIDERDSDHRGGRNRVGSAIEVARYAGFSLRLSGHASVLEPQVALDPSIRRHNRLRVVDTAPRSSERRRTKRRAHSDPPPMLDLGQCSSEEDYRS